MAEQQQHNHHHHSQGHRRRMYGKRLHRKVLPLSLYDGTNVYYDSEGDEDDYRLLADTIGLVHTTEEESRKVEIKGTMSSGGAVDKRRGQSAKQRQSKILEEADARMVGVGGDDVAAAVVAEKLEGLRLELDDGDGDGDGDDDDLRNGEQGVEKGEEASQLVLSGERDGERTGLRRKSGPLREKDGNIGIVSRRDNAGRGCKKGMKSIAKIKGEDDAKHLGEVKDFNVMKVKEEEKKKKSSPLQSRTITRNKSTCPSRSNTQCKTTTRKLRVDVSETQKRIPSPVLTRAKVETITTTTTSTATPPQKPSISLLNQSLPIKSPAFLPDLVSHATPLLALATDPLARNAPLPFCTWSDELSTYFDIVKIAEASYGEVYRLALRKEKVLGLNESEIKGRNEAANMTTGESVMKVIPLDAPIIKDLNSSMISSPPPSPDPMPSSAVSAVTSEVQLLRRMATVPGFTNFRDVRVVYGRPGQAFIDAWRDFREEKLLPKDEDSAFPDPGRVVGSGSGKRGRKKIENIERQRRQIEMQLWAVIEMEDAGMDLEGFDVVGLVNSSSSSSSTTTTTTNSVAGHSESSSLGVFGVWDVFWNVATALAKGEREARFEHRDLHLGNICVRYSPSSSSSPSVLSSQSIVDKLDRKLGFTGLETTIIDYTLSRADLNDVDDTNAEEKREKPSCPEPGTPTMNADAERQSDKTFSVAYLDLESDPALFEGDGNVDTQYNFYRYMRAALLTSDPLALVPPPLPIPTPDDSKNNKSDEDTRRTRTRRNEPKKMNDDDKTDVNITNQFKTKESPWRTFHPQTNLVWLNFVLGRLMASLDDWQRVQRRDAKQRQQRQRQQQHQEDPREARITQMKMQKIKEDNDDASAHPSRIFSSSSSSSPQNKARNKAEQKQTDTDTDADTVMKTQSKSQTQSQIEIESETKRLDQRARSLSRILRKVQRALDLDALAGKSPATAKATRTTRTTRRMAVVCGSEGGEGGMATGRSRGRGKARSGGKSKAKNTATGQAGQAGQASVRSTIELVGWAVAEGWLDLEDVVL